MQTLTIMILVSREQWVRNNQPVAYYSHKWIGHLPSKFQSSHQLVSHPVFAYSHTSQSWPMSQHTSAMLHNVPCC